MAMNNRGFTLVEILVVIGIIGILLSIAVRSFVHDSNKAKVERQTRELYVDLMTARTDALTKEGNKRITLTPTYYSYTSLGGVWTKGFRRPLTYGITWAGGWATKLIDFDEKGGFDIVGNGNTSICVNNAAADDALYNSVVVYSTRIQMGKLKQGAACGSNDIDVK